MQALGIDLLDAAYKLSNSIPQIISVGLNMNQSRGVLSATVNDIVEAMEKAVLPALPEKAAWLASRGKPPPTHGAASARVPHSPPATATLARIPDEVPDLPAAFQPRHELNEALKESVLNRQASASATTSVTAPPRSKRSHAAHTTATSGMGGVGKNAVLQAATWQWPPWPF